MIEECKRIQKEVPLNRLARGSIQDVSLQVPVTNCVPLRGTQQTIWDPSRTWWLVKPLIQCLSRKHGQFCGAGVHLIYLNPGTTGSFFMLLFFIVFPLHM